MSEPQATPRPWEVHDGEDYTVVLGASGRGIAHDVTDNPIARVAEIADAQLIVTAVNAHDASKARIAALTEFLDNARAHALAGNKDEVYAELRGDFCESLLEK